MLRTSLVATTAVLGVAVSAAAGAPLSIIHEKQASARYILNGPGALTPDRGALREEPSDDGVWGPARLSPARIGKVSYRDIEGRSAEDIASLLKGAVDHGCIRNGANFGCESHMVIVDEINADFGDGPPPKAPSRHFRSRAQARAAAPRPEIPLPPVDPASNGARLTAAMQMLNVPSPYGGTYASRVHFYIAPTITTSIGKGIGINQNLGRDRRPHFKTWRGVMPGLALSGGIWLEMYHGHPIGPFKRVEWQRYPADVARLFGQFGGTADKIHFVMTNSHGMRPAGAGRCGSTMSCIWKWADQPGANHQILTNGVGAFNLQDEAHDWLVQYNAHVGA